MVTTAEHSAERAAKQATDRGFERTAGHSPARAALVLIECQREWLDEAGTLNEMLHDRAQFATALDGAKRATAAARAAGTPVVHCGLRFEPGHPELGEAALGLRAAIRGADTFRADAPGSGFPPPFTPEPGEFVVRGRVGGSAFAGSNLDVYLRNNRIDVLYLVGFALHVCVESTLRVGHDLGYAVTVLHDACAAFTAGQRRHVLNDVVHHFGAHDSVEAFERVVRRSAATTRRSSAPSLT